MKQAEIHRLVKDSVDEYSYINKNETNIKSLIYMIFGETAYEIEFFR